MFQYTPIEWENLKYRYITEDPNSKPEWYSYEHQNTVYRNPSAWDYPFVAELKKIAKKHNWESLKRDSGNLDVVELVDQLSLDVKLKADKIAHINKTLGFLANTQSRLQGLIDDRLEGLSHDETGYQYLSYIEKTKVVAALIDRWEKLNKTNRVYLGINDIGGLMEKLITNFGQGKTIDQVALELQNMDEIELTRFFAEVTGK